MKKDRKSPRGSRLREARSEHGWSQQDLADQVGTTSVNISRWENGSTFPTPYFRQRLCEVFDKTPAELGLLPPPAPGSRIWNVPIVRNPFFIGREDLLALLHKRLSTTRAAALIQPQALYGLGGIGKTQAAAEYAFRYGDDYPHVFWMYAATRETLVTDFVALATLLDLPEKDEQDQRQIVAAVKQWLAAHEGWLLILDNADNLLLAQEFLPTSHKGYILFTTRSQAVGSIAASVEVEKLSLQEGTLLLLRWTKLLDMDSSLEQAQAEDRDAAERIVREMDGLPLALVQAAAYVEETGCSLADYLRLYPMYRKDLLKRRSHLLLNYPEAVATTWLLSFQQIEQANSAAADLLRLCAFLAPDAIPEVMLDQGAAELGPVLEFAARNPIKLNEALDVLRRYSLVKRNSSTHMLNIHRLVQTVLKESMDQETQRTWAERTVRAVNAVFPDASAGKNHQDYLPHVQECAALIKQYDFSFPEAVRLLYQAADFLYIHGFYPQAHSFHQQCLAIRKQVCGPDDPTIAESLNALAVLFRFQGDYGQAEAFHRQALAVREKVLGPDHFVTTESLNNLGVLYRNQGKYEQAEPLLQRALTARKQLRGAEHPDTLVIFINLAKLYLEQQQYEQAEQLLEQALASSERVPEAGKPLIAQTLNLLARLSYEQGNYERAETLWKRALVLIKKVLGPDHPATAERLNDLAELCFARGRYAEAESFCRRALSICEKMLGSEHPDTITVRELLNSIVSKREEEQDHEP